MHRFLLFGYASLVVGGLLLAAGAGLHATLGSPLSAIAVTPAFAISAALRLAGATGMIVGMTAITAAASLRGGRLALAAGVLVTANLVLQAGWMWADLFLSHAVAGSAPGVLDGTIDDPRLSIGFLTAWLMNVSFAFLGLVVLRTRSHRRLAGWGLVLMGVITLIPLPVDGPIYEVVIGLVCAMVGVAARTPITARTPSHPEAQGTSIPA